MALVLRKTITPKNVFFLKCMKGRKLSTAVYKKNTTPFFSAAVRHGYRRQKFSSNALKVRKTERLPVHVRNCNHMALLSRRSCPNIDAKGLALPNRTFSTTRLSCQTHVAISKREYSKVCSVCCPCSAPCPCPCKNPCTCLPPPCNTPPRCLQYMTGYYYYPYGTWFCGPYHNAGCACVTGKGLCPCPKCCCAACICNVPTSEDDKDKRKLKCSVNAESPCQTLIELRTGTFFDNKPENKNEPKPKKEMPSILGSMIEPSPKLPSSNSTDSKIPKKYPVLYNKFKRNLHTQAKFFNKVFPHEIDNIFYQSPYKPLKDISMPSGKQKKQETFFSKSDFKYSRREKKERINQLSQLIYRNA